MRLKPILLLMLAIMSACEADVDSDGAIEDQDVEMGESNVEDFPIVSDVVIDPSINIDHLGVWRENVNELFTPTSYTFEDSSLEIEGVRELYYNSITYDGARKRVFAYYSNPDIVLGNETNTEASYPAVVCVHGGGGRAYEAWVKKWADRGYAALAMDWRGYGPYTTTYPTDEDRLDGGFVENANRTTPYFVMNEDITDDWFYQAVGDVICAHTLLLSLPEVDTSRTAITGFSWGGILTTLVSGIDSRFKAAVPVYGCGYIYGSDGLTTTLEDRWQQSYDPSLYVQWSEMPMLFINGTNDPHFYLDQWQRTTELPAGKVDRSVRLEMAHGGSAAWSVEETYKFVGESLGVVSSDTIPTFEDIETTNTEVSCRIDGYVSGDKVYLLHTTSDVVSIDAEWSETLLTANEAGEVVATIGEDYTQWIIGIEQAADASNFTSEVFFRLD